MFFLLSAKGFRFGSIETLNPDRKGFPRIASDEEVQGTADKHHLRWTKINEPINSGTSVVVVKVPRSTDTATGGRSLYSSLSRANRGP
jgi:hypothetical protein